MEQYSYSPKVDRTGCRIFLSSLGLVIPKCHQVLQRPRQQVLFSTPLAEVAFSEPPQVFRTQIDATNLPARLRNALARAGIRTAVELRNLSDVDLLSLPMMAVPHSAQNARPFTGGAMEK